MSSPAEGGDAGTPGPDWYPDPSIPGYIRYWNGASWVPGSSRRRPEPGQAMPAPPPGAPAPRPAPVPAPEETGPVFLDGTVGGGSTGPGGPGGTSPAGFDVPPSGNVEAARGGTALPGGPGAFPDAVDPVPGVRSGAPPVLPELRRRRTQRPDTAVSPGSAESAAPPAAFPGAGAPAGGRTPRDPRLGPAGIGAGWASADDMSTSPVPSLPDAGTAAAERIPRPAAGRHPAPATDTPERPTAPAGHAPAGHTPGGHAPAGHAPAGHTPGGHAPAGHAPAGHAPAGTGTDITRPGPGAERPHPGRDAARPAPDPAALSRPAAGTVGPSTHPAPVAPGVLPPGRGAEGVPPGVRSAPSPTDRGERAESDPRTVSSPAGPGWTDRVQDLARPAVAPGPVVPDPPTPRATPGAPGVPAHSRPGPTPVLRSAHPTSAGVLGAPEMSPLTEAGLTAVRTPAPWEVEDDAYPASPVRRILARLVDGLLPAAAAVGVALPFAGPARDHIEGKITAVEQAGVTEDVWLVDGTTGPWIVLVLGVFLLAGLLLEALPMALWGRTPGKALCGLRVVDMGSRDRPGIGAALIRWFTHTVLWWTVVGAIGVVLALFDRPWRQGWHDRVARTFVAGRRPARSRRPAEAR
ncbi:RDD family protein [Streptomyces sp. ST2-7A]|uniref:RDD family protein n=1 Tax=Streptomyces sp. ST2-7A TaxID=2907214 RepID=UPI001F412ADE|nr:RDD family protein [Streptomyces sp. ST2-7A]MCE7082545.1 RDD family protein [Streptomyces sp. ST2-7A]